LSGCYRKAEHVGVAVEEGITRVADDLGHFELPSLRPDPKSRPGNLKMPEPAAPTLKDIFAAIWAVPLDELIRCNRPEGVRYRLLLQEATTITTDGPDGLTPFAKTGWYDDGRMQTWAFVFWRGTGAGGPA
jgi:hypothetical protein